MRTPHRREYFTPKSWFLPLTSRGHAKRKAHLTDAGLVGAAILSTLVFPFVGLALRKRSEAALGTA